MEFWVKHTEGELTLRETTVNCRPLTLPWMALLIAAFAVWTPLALAQQAEDETSGTAVPEASAPAQKPAAKTASPPLDPALELLDPRTYRLKVLIKVEASEGAVTNVVAVGPIPIEWPEQKLRLLSEKVTPGAKVTETILKGQAGMVKIQVPTLVKGGTLSFERLYEVTRYRTHFTMPPEELVPPKMPPRELRDQLTGQAPGIETTHPKMIELSDSLKRETEGGVVWDQIKGKWSWTRENVKFQNGDFRGALFAIENHCGDCEEMSALFIGLCRLSGQVARTVWVEGHDYPEFYLLDKKGKGHWIPAQVVGPPWFGEIIEYRPIFQKGDRFYDPFQKQYVRYVPHTLKTDATTNNPKLIVEHQIIADSDINGPSYDNPK